MPHTRSRPAHSTTLRAGRPPLPQSGPPTYAGEPRDTPRAPAPGSALYRARGRGDGRPARGHRACRWCCGTALYPPHPGCRPCTLQSSPARAFRAGPHQEGLLCQVWRHLHCLQGVLPRLSQSSSYHGEVPRAPCAPGASACAWWATAACVGFNATSSLPGHVFHWHASPWPHPVIHATWLPRRSWLPPLPTHAPRCLYSSPCHSWQTPPWRPRWCLSLLALPILVLSCLFSLVPPPAHTFPHLPVANRRQRRQWLAGQHARMRVERARSLASSRLRLNTRLVGVAAHPPPTCNDAPRSQPLVQCASRGPASTSLREYARDDRVQSLAAPLARLPAHSAETGPGLPPTCDDSPVARSVLSHALRTRVACLRRARCAQSTKHVGRPRPICGTLRAHRTQHAKAPGPYCTKRGCMLPNGLCSVARVVFAVSGAHVLICMLYLSASESLATRSPLPSPSSSPSPSPSP